MKIVFFSIFIAMAFAYDDPSEKDFQNIEDNPDRSTNVSMFAQIEENEKRTHTLVNKNKIIKRLRKKLKNCDKGQNGSGSNGRHVATGNSELANKATSVWDYAEKQLLECKLDESSRGNGIEFCLRRMEFLHRVKREDALCLGKTCRGNKKCVANVDGKTSSCLDVLCIGKTCGNNERCVVNIAETDWSCQFFDEEIDFSTYGGSAHGSSHNGQQPTAAFLKTGGFWHSGPQDVVPPFTARHVPQAIWWKFTTAVRVVKFSFASRPGDKAVSDGATDYVFWGSNDDDCSEQTNWVTLHEDNPGTPFTSDNTPKEVELDNETAYTCYGLKITAVGGRSGGDTPVTMSNIRYYIME